MHVQFLQLSLEPISAQHIYLIERSGNGCECNVFVLQAQEPLTSPGTNDYV